MSVAAEVAVGLAIGCAFAVAIHLAIWHDWKTLESALLKDAQALLREWAEYDPGDLRSGGWCGDCDVHDGNCVHARTVTLLRRMNGRPPLTPPRT